MTNEKELLERSWACVWQAAALSHGLHDLKFELDVAGSGIGFYWTVRKQMAASTDRLANGFSMVKEASLCLRAKAGMLEEE